MNYVHWNTAIRAYLSTQPTNEDAEARTGFTLAELDNQLSQSDQHPQNQAEHRVQFLEAVLRRLLDQPSIPETTTRTVLHHALTRDLPEGHLLQSLELDDEAGEAPAKLCLCQDPELDVVPVAVKDGDTWYYGCPRCGRRLEL